MVQTRKLEGQVEINCNADKVLEMFLGKQQHLTSICSNQVTNIEAHQRDWVSVGSTRQWDYVIDGKTETIVERIEAVDEKNKIIRRKFIDGEMMKTNYKDFTTIMEFIPKGNDSCSVKITFEYEKLNENADEPHKLFNFSLGVIEGLGPHLANA